MNVNIKIIARPGRKIIQSTPKIPLPIPIKTRNVVKVPSIYDKPHVPIIVKRDRPQRIKPPIPKPIAKPPDNRIEERKTEIIHAKIKQASIVRRAQDKIKPSVLKKVHDALLDKHKDNVRRLKDIGRDKVLVILACGWSINEIENIEKLKTHPRIDIMCINKPEPRVWPSTYWMLCDQSQYNRNKDFWEPYKGIIINASSVKAHHPNQIVARALSGKGFSRDIVSGFHIGRSTTYAAMQVALWMGYNKIYIAGLDMCAVGGKLHRYGVNPDVDPDNRVKRFDKESESYDFAANTLREQEKSVFVICSTYNPYKFANAFQRVDHRKMVDEVWNYANSLTPAKDKL